MLVATAREHRTKYNNSEDFIVSLRGEKRLKQSTHKENKINKL